MFKKIKDFLFKNTNTKQTVVKNTIWLSISNYGGKLIKAIIVIYGARVLSTAGYGVFSYAVTLAGFVGIFLDPGINSILIRDFSNASEEKKMAVFSTTLAIKIALIIFGILIVLVAGPYFSTLPGAPALLLLVALMLSFDTMRDFLSSLLRAREKMEWDAAIFLFTNVAIVVLGFIFLHMSPTAKSFAWAYALGTGAGALAALIVIFPYLKKSIFHFSSELVLPILRAAWPFAVIGTLGLLLTNTDILIISWIRSASDVGIYSAVIRLIQGIYLVPGILQTSTLPILSRLAKQSNEKFREALERTLGIVFLISVPLALGGAILAAPIMVLIFGAPYHAGSSSFAILMLGIVFDYPASIIAAAVFAYNHQKGLIISSAIAGIANVVFDIFFISHFGIVGSAVATVCAQILSNWYLWHMMKKINYFEIMPSLKKIAGAGAIMAVVTILLFLGNVNLVINVLVSAVIYFGLLWIFREPLAGEMRRIIRGPAHG